jgi:hypothetical protein
MGLRGILAFAFLMMSILACGRTTPVGIDVFFGDPDSPGSADPPYLDTVTFANGLRLRLVESSSLTRGYPGASGNPFGSSRERHYQPVQFFIPLQRVSLSHALSENFILSEFVAPTVDRGGEWAYVDAQIADHVQRIRSGLGRAVILSSAFRAPEHNEAIGGASFSRHLYGDAVDIDVDQGRSDASTVGQEVFNEAVDAGVDFVLPLLETSVDVSGQTRVSWVHIDDRGFR